MSIGSRTALLVSALLLVALTAAPAAAAHTVARGLADIGLVEASQSARGDIMGEYVKLRVKYLRLGFEWSRAEPAPDSYDEAYLAAFDDIAALAQEHGIKLMLSVFSTPKWASDHTLWNKPPPGKKANAYYPVYPPAPGADGHIDDFGAFAAYLSSRPGLTGKVFAYECWNEPNLWTFLYPQVRTAGDDFAVKRYAKMLEAFDAGIEAGDPNALVIAGATAPIGSIERLRNRTTPQHFARVLKKQLGGARHFDAYSHHPYTPGGSSNMAPEALPSVPSTTVQLRNLGTLLDVFPTKPFYLTEYGYNTSFSGMFGGSGLSQTVQADYLRRAYRYAGRYGQVKALLWYLRCDDDRSEVYTGLCRANTAEKRSWFTFAGGNRLTLDAPRSVRRGQVATLRGKLTSTRLGPLAVTGVAGKSLDVQRRVGGHWRKLKNVTTRPNGACSFGVRLTSSGYYRLVWSGVVTSPARRIAVK